MRVASLARTKIQSLLSRRHTTSVMWNTVAYLRDIRLVNVRYYEAVTDCFSRIRIMCSIVTGSRCVVVQPIAVEVTADAAHQATVGLWNEDEHTELTVKLDDESVVGAEYYVR